MSVINTASASIKRFQLINLNVNVSTYLVNDSFCNSLDLLYFFSTVLALVVTSMNKKSFVS